MDFTSIATLVIAGYGAVLGTFNFFQARQKDARKVRVVLKTDFPVYGGRLGPPMLSIGVTNIGHRAVLVEAPTIEVGDKHIVLPYADGADQFPAKLGDGETRTLRVPEVYVAEALRGNGYHGKVEIAALCKDTAGTTHRSKPTSFEVARAFRLSA